MIIAININPTTQSYIAEMFNDGVEPQIETEPTWFIARDDEPNLIVNRHEYTTVWKDLVDKDIIALSNE